MQKIWKTGAILAFMAVAGVTAGDLRADDPQLETAIFAGGCFWCVESDFDAVPGVVETVSGYTGGDLENPTYRNVTGGGTGHLEAVRITFDASVISYEEMVHMFWRTVDPTDSGGQFCDRGHSYTTAIFATTAEQLAIAEASKQALIDAGTLDDPIVTPVLEAKTFYDAEDYHQDYHNTHSYRYTLYRFGCGRDARVKSLWGDEAWGGEEHS